MRPLRAFLAVAVALGLAPGTVWRSDVRPIDPGAAIVFTPADIAPDARRQGPLLLTGAWALSSMSRGLGGYSALIARSDGSLLAASDAGGLLAIERPGTRAMEARFLAITGSAERDKRDADAEAMAHDPASGRIWAAYEGSNAIEALTPDLAPIRRIEPAAMADWRSNSGPESFARLADGRFVAIAEVVRMAADTQPRAGPLLYLGAAPRHERGLGEARDGAPGGGTLGAPRRQRPADLAPDLRFQRRVS